MLRNFIDSFEKLDNLLKKTITIPNAETAKIAIVRPTTHFKIETPDNPDMVHTLKLQEAYVEERLTSAIQLAVQNDLTITDEQKQNLVRKFQDEFQHDLSQKALKEQNDLIDILKKNEIMTVPLLEDKITLSNSGFDYFTDQIFATDTGQYYFDNDSDELCFIPAHFKNTQRMGEERLAVLQAEHLGAKIKPLVDEKGNQLIFEGGDIRQMPGKKLFFIGQGLDQGLRTDPRAAEIIAKMTGYIVLPIVLLKKQFYHLDCCFLPLPRDAAMIYEGEYVLDENNQPKIGCDGMPMLLPGTETMDAKSRALIRHIYPPNKLVTITEAEALAFATNAAVLEDKNGRFKMFVNGEPEATTGLQEQTAIDLLEQEKLRTQSISLSEKHIKEILEATENKMEIIKTPFNTMHGSGGSVRCTIQEVPCSQKRLALYLHGKAIGSDVIDQIENTRKIPKTDLFFTYKKPLPLSSEAPQTKTNYKFR
jgi:N-dimethylarginine dimethylaminohydrolase